MENKQRQGQKEQKKEPKPYRLYVAFDKKKSGSFNMGSKLCMKILEENSELAALVRVENLDTILMEKKREELPSWLDGSPTLVDVKRMRVHHGSSARDKLLDLLDDVSGGNGGPSKSSTLESNFDQVMRPNVQNNSFKDERYTKATTSFSSSLEDGQNDGGDEKDEVFWNVDEPIDDRKKSNSSTDQSEMIQALLKQRNLETPST